MISSITIKNFETHLDTSFDLHSGVNTFVGDSDDGKSGLIRALKWNSKNRPQGDSYRNDQLDPKKDKKKICSVGVDYKGDGVVIRQRDNISQGINNYVINNGEPLRALRKDLPQEVKNVTKMKDVNIQGQHPTEQYFLLADKPGQVAKEFNKVAGLTIMDDANAEINSIIRTVNATINVAKKEIKTRTNDLKESEWVIDADKMATKLKKYSIKLNKKINKLGLLNNLLNSISKIDEELASFKGLNKAKKALNELTEQKQDIKDKKERQLEIENTISALIDVDSELKGISDTKEALKALNELKILELKIEYDKESIGTITTMLDKLDYNSKSIKIAEMKFKEAKKQYDTIRLNFECPTCGRKGK